MSSSQLLTRAPFLLRLTAVLHLAILASCAAPAPDPTAVLHPATSTQYVFPPTFTPGPTDPPADTATPRPSRTPAPTNTLAATLSPSATPLINIAIASAEDQPAVSANLLYLADGRVEMWDYLNGAAGPAYTDLLPTSDVFSISVSAAGRVVAAAVRTASGDRILVIDRLAETTLLDFTLTDLNVEDMVLSPDGSWLAFTAIEELAPPSVTPAPTATALPTDAPTPTESPTATATAATPVGTTETIFLARVAPGEQAAAAALCEERCSELLWLPAGAAFIWGDLDGLWQAGISGGGGPEVVLLAPPFLTGLSGVTETLDSYFPLSASPSGRFVLARLGLDQGSVLVVIDRITGLVENLPGTGEYTGAGTGVAWLGGDLLFIARPGVARLDLGPAGEVWLLSPDAEEDFFLSGGVYPLPGDVYALPSAPFQLPDGRVGFALINMRDGNDAAVNGLYLLDLLSGSLERLNFLPLLQVEQVLWLPDLSAALVESSSRLLLVPDGYDPVYTLAGLLGTTACCFHWVP